MHKKRTKAQLAERLLYMLTVLIIPSIPLFFLFSQNAAQGLLFRHFLIFGGVLGAISLIIYLPISRFLLRRRRTMVLIALFWSGFWFFEPIGDIIKSSNTEVTQERILVYLLAFIIVAGFVLRWVSFNRYLANIVAIVFCVLFIFNFAPEAIAVAAGERQRAENERTGELPYRIKTEFYIDPNLPSPNIYWIHMDGMMSFEAVEYFFGDSQTELKKELVEHGFLINESARLEAGMTWIAIPALTSPTFYSSYLVEEFARVAKFTPTFRNHSIHATMRERGFSFSDINLSSELIRAFSDIEYTIISNQSWVLESEDVDMRVDGFDVTSDIRLTREANIAYGKLLDFRDLILDASALSVIKHIVDEFVERKRPDEDNPQPLPEYTETVSKYITGYSDSADDMAAAVRAIKHATTVQSPKFIYLADLKAHCNGVEGYEIGGVLYDEYIGVTFIFDEHGDIYKERLNDPNDIHLYLPQHKYAAKQMMAMIETIIENDPEAVIVVQADHGIHGFGPGSDFYDSEFMLERGYSLEDQLFMNFSTISAVRVPSQYGTLSQPLDPLDIARWLVNNFVGGGNYEYLYYEE